MKSRKLRAVPKDGEPLDMARDIYAETRAKRDDPADRDRWAKVHIEADRRNVPRRWWRLT